MKRFIAAGKRLAKEYRLLLYILVATLVVLGVLYLYDTIGVQNVPNVVMSKESQLLTNTALTGDSFGKVNALFSGLAFAGLICALFVQIAEFHLAEHERTEGLIAQKEIARQQTYSSLSSAITTLRTTDRVPYGGTVGDEIEARQCLLVFEQRAALEATVSHLIDELREFKGAFGRKAEFRKEALLQARCIEDVLILLHEFKSTLETIRPAEDHRAELSKTLNQFHAAYVNVWSSFTYDAWRTMCDFVEEIKPLVENTDLSTDEQAQAWEKKILERTRQKAFVLIEALLRRPDDTRK